MAKPERKPAPSKIAAEVRGRRAETWAVVMLSCKGYRILGRRVKTPLGEIDLIAKTPGGTVCFIEVKARADHGAAIESIMARQQGRIARAADLYLAARPHLRGKSVRFDAILVAPGKWPRHVRDAWRPGA